MKRKCEFCGEYDKEENMEHEYNRVAAEDSHFRWYHPRCLWLVIEYGEEHPLINKALHIFSLMKKRHEQEKIYKEKRRKALEEAKRYLDKEEHIEEHLSLNELKRSIGSMKKDLDFVCKWIRSGNEYNEWIDKGNREEDLM